MLESRERSQNETQNHKFVLLFCVAIILLQLTLERDEHKLVIDQLSTLEPERKAFRLIGGILVEKTVGEALPAVQQNYEGVSY